MDLRSFWRIIFNPSNRAEPPDNSFLKPRLFMEIVIWDMENGRRLGRSITPLEYHLVGDVTIGGGVARFDGGWIKAVMNRGALEAKLMSLIKTGVSVSGTLSEVVDGLNVCITAEVRLPLEGGERDCPLFYMPQPSTGGIFQKKGEPPGRDYVRLIETIYNAGERRIKWSISGDTHNPLGYFLIDDQPDTNHPHRGFHRVRVNQDTRESGGGYVYEIEADVMRLEDAPRDANPSSHYFSAEVIEFYIGGMLDPWGKVVGLKGEITYLEFDPNNACPGCFSNLG